MKKNGDKAWVGKAFIDCKIILFEKNKKKTEEMRGWGKPSLIARSCLKEKKRRNCVGGKSLHGVTLTACLGGREVMILMHCMPTSVIEPKKTTFLIQKKTQTSDF